MAERSSFMLVNRSTQEVFEFAYFPESLDDSGETNWREFDTAGDAQPIFYVNRSPDRLAVRVMLDRSEKNESVTPEMRRLKELRTPIKSLGVRGRGAPPVLHALWGDETFRGVLIDVNFSRAKCLSNGVPIRVFADFSLKEIQAEPSRAQQSSARNYKTVFVDNFEG